MLGRHFLASRGSTRSMLSSTTYRRLPSVACGTCPKRTTRTSEQSKNVRVILTSTTIPLERYRGYEPTAEGVSVHFTMPAGAEISTELNLIEVRELRDDMEEAN